MYLENIGDCVRSRESIGTGTPRPLDPPLFFGWTISLNVNLSILDPDSHRALALTTPTYRPPPQSRELVPWNNKKNILLVSTRPRQQNFSTKKAVAKFMIPDWGDIVASCIALSYQHASLCSGTTTLCKSQLHPPSQGLWIWLLDITNFLTFLF